MPVLIHNCGMKRTVSLKAYAKVNLQLDVLGVRPDGYHELAGIMQSVSLHDEIIVSVLPAPARSEPLVRVSFDAPVPFHNTVRRAAELYLGSEPCSVNIGVKKHIPSEAGLGGASADAAAALRGLNALFAGTALERSFDELLSLGLSVGADVPFCLTGGCATATGVGEKITPLPFMPMTLVILKGERGVATPRLFKLFDELICDNSSRLPEDALPRAVEAITAQNAPALGELMKNALEPAALTLAPEIADELAVLRRFGALGACMTGSGSAVVGLFRDEAAARPLLSYIEGLRSERLFFALCSSRDQGTDFI